MSTLRNLRSDEISEAKKVFRETIQYNKVFIQQHNGGAMTYAYNKGVWDWYYVIFWNANVFSQGAVNAGESRTFIHEMVHVWQGHYGTYPREYMIKSGAAQTSGVFEDVWEKGAKELVKRVWNNGPINAWHSYRNRAYAFSMNQMGVNNFNDFNVEQQAGIIESWYASTAETNHLGETIPGGNMSTTDIRYPFITCNILAKAPNAQYIQLKQPANQNTSQQLGRGADAKIKAIQDVLVQLRYLDPKYANGYMNKQTKDAVIGFQRNNGLKPDGDIGGPNSQTRKKLGVR